MWKGIIRSNEIPKKNEKIELVLLAVRKVAKIAYDAIVPDSSTEGDTKVTKYPANMMMRRGMVKMISPYVMNLR